MAKVGKKYSDSVKLIEKNKMYDPAELLIFQVDLLV